MFAQYGILNLINLPEITKSAKQIYLILSASKRDLLSKKYTGSMWTYSQWCNLILTQRFWVTKVCLWESNISKICLFGRPTGQATS